MKFAWRQKFTSCIFSSAKVQSVFEISYVRHECMIGPIVNGLVHELLRSKCEVKDHASSLLESSFIVLKGENDSSALLFQTK